MTSTQKTKATFEFPDHAKNESRLAELVVYLAEKCAGDETFGAVKLNKILYFADFTSYQRYGESITGVAYMKLENGPVPRKMVPTKERLTYDGAIEEVEMMYHGYNQKRIVAKRHPQLDMFSARDMAMVDEIVDRLRNRNALNVSEMSHTIAWKIAGDKGNIPYQSVFLSDVTPTDADCEWARNLNNEHHWNA